MDSRLNQQINAAFGRRHHLLCGRGTTALWLGLRAIRRRSGPGDVILPDILCRTVLDGVLLAGFRPVFAGVTPGRFTLDAGEVARRVTPDTRAIIAAHVFGHIADLDALRRAAPVIPLIEDAVQGLGGYFEEPRRPAGSVGDLSFISFDDAKMIGGRGGVLLLDDEMLLDGIETDLRNLELGHAPDLALDVPDTLLPPVGVRAYADQLRATAASLLRPMNAAVSNVERILEGWRTLPERVAARNEKAAWLRTQLSGLPLTLPPIRTGDAIWRYTLAAPTIMGARRMMRGLQLAGLSGSGLYYPLSRFLGVDDRPADMLTNRLVNLWVDEATGTADLRRAAEIISAIPWDRLPG